MQPVQPVPSVQSASVGAHLNWARRAASFDGMPDFDAQILKRLQRLRFFRAPTDREVDASFAAYQSGDVGRLLRTWNEAAQPTRAHIAGLSSLIYASVGTLPRPLRRLAVLATLRAVLAAGVRFRAGLRPAVRSLLETDFPWLEGRHPHIPAGFTPHFDFPAEFATFLQSGSLDDARARWQLCAAINEVQQSRYSSEMAVRCRLPELNQQADREADLARNYFAHAAPPATRDLWRQCIVILDALNAAVLDLTCSTRGPLIVWRAALASLRTDGREQWPRFVAGLAQPQRLLPHPVHPNAIF